MAKTRLGGHAPNRQSVEDQGSAGLLHDLPKRVLLRDLSSVELKEVATPDPDLLSVARRTGQ